MTVRMENNTSVNEGNQKVTVAKTVMEIDYLTAISNPNPNPVKWPVATGTGSQPNNMSSPLLPLPFQNPLINISVLESDICMNKTLTLQ